MLVSVDMVTDCNP